MIPRWAFRPIEVTDVDGRTYTLRLSSSPGYYSLVDSSGRGHKVPDYRVEEKWGHLLQGPLADSSG